MGKFVCIYKNEAFMRNFFLKIITITIVFSACKPEVVKYSINFDINGGAGKYLKILDMTKPGLTPDSVELDMGGKYNFERVTHEPGDYIIYFNSIDYIRITPLPKETISVIANKNNMLSSAKITGSEESAMIKTVLLKHKNTLYTLDTLNTFYMNHQTHEKLDSIVERLSNIRDSVIADEKQYLESFIEKQPGTFASYVALSQKIGYNINMFTLQADLKYFEMVDTALFNRFDTCTIVNMLNTYVKRGKIELRQKQKTEKKADNIIGTTAPNIALPNPYGDTLNLASLKGKYVLVDFWGTWCRPCRQEHPNLRKAYWRYRKQGFDVFQVAIDHDKTAWTNCIREDKLNWRNHVSDLQYMENAAAKAYGVNSLPANFLINPQGEIIAQNLYGTQLLDSLSVIFTNKPKPAAIANPNTTTQIPL